MAKRTDPAFVTDLGNRLMKAKAECKLLQAEWDALWSGPNSKDGVTSADGPLTLSVKIAQFLNKSPGEAFTSDQVSNSLVLNKQSTATTLSKLVKSGLINKQGSDQYISKLPVSIVESLELPEEVAQ
jgi:hypothetical protein